MTGTSSDVAFADAYLKGVKRLRRAGRLRRRAEERDGRRRRPRRDVGRKGLATSTFLGYTRDRRPARACRGRWRATSTTSASRTWPRRSPRTRHAAERARYTEESEYFLNRAPGLREPVRPDGRLLPGPRRRRAPGESTRRLRPAGLGRRLHRDRRLELRLPRPAGRPGPGQPLRRPRRARRRSSTRSSPRPRRRQVPRLLRRLDPRDARGARRPDGPVGHSNQVSHHIPYMYDYAGQPCEDAGEGPRGAARGSTSAARSARATPATRTTARCRPGTSSPRSASTRCRWAAPNYAIGSPLFTQGDGPPGERQATWSINAPEQQREATSTCRALQGQRQGVRQGVPRHRRPDRERRRRSSSTMGPKPSTLGHRQGRRAAVDHRRRRGRRSRCAT